MSDPTAWRPLVATRSVAAARAPGVPSVVVAGLLLTCVFAPYGLLPFGGGTLRPDHLATYLVFGGAWVSGRITRFEPLAVGLFLIAGISTAATVVFLPFVEGNPLTAMKTLDGLVRAAMVLSVAASIDLRGTAERTIERVLLAIPFLLAAMAVTERVLPLHNRVVAAWIDMYGGPKYDSGVFGTWNVNHKAVMLMTDRATAVFPTAPSLGIVSVLLIGLVFAEIQGTLKHVYVRYALVAACIAAGVACNSKSFAFGLPLAYLLALLLRGKLTGLGVGALSALAGLWAATVVLARTPSDDPDGATVSQLTGGRLVAHSPIIDTMYTVLSDSPIVGYGLGNNPKILWYADSGLNYYLLHAGILGMIALGVGVARQHAWFRFRMHLTPWATLGALTQILCLVMFIAGPVLVMPRVNDIAAVLIGVSIALTRRAEQLVRKTEQSGSNHPGGRAPIVGAP